jgi:hypothetical protein
MAQSLSQAQFGQNAAEYLTSRPHAQGKSLDRMVALARPQPRWHMLDETTPAAVKAFFAVKGNDRKLTFRLREALFIAHRT